MATGPGAPAIELSAADVLRFRATASHLDRRLAPGAYAAAAWGGLQDSIPRAGLTSLHARVESTAPDAWEDPSLVQIWFRGGADYLVPRRDVGVFTLGSYPRDAAAADELERVADEIHRICAGRTLPVAEVAAGLRDGGPFAPRHAAVTGRLHIRWDASRIWLIPAERPELDAEDARRELARRFLHWYGPATIERLARWTGVERADAVATWATVEPDLAPVIVAGHPGFVLREDVELFRGQPDAGGSRLLPRDDPFTRYDGDLLVPDPARRRDVLPPVGVSPGHIPGAILVGGQIAGAWQRQRGRIRLRPFLALAAEDRAAVELEARTMPVPGVREPDVAWEPPAL